MKRRVGSNYFMKILGVLFLVFISLYIALESGYYEAKTRKRTEVTEESIRKFEQDIKDGKEVDVEKYIVDEKKDYSNKTTDMAIYIGDKVEKFMATGISDLLEIVKALVG